MPEFLFSPSICATAVTSRCPQVNDPSPRSGPNMLAGKEIKVHWRRKGYALQLEALKH